MKTKTKTKTTKTLRTNVRSLVCEEKTVERFLDLGRTALANKFLTKEELRQDRSRPAGPECSPSKSIFDLRI